MRRNYSREAYLERIAQVRTMIPGCAISSDFISGFCGETEEDHRATLSLLELVAYEHAFMFAYSMREKTHTHRKLVDDVPEAVKSRRLNEVINTFHTKAIGVSQRELGKQHLVLIDGVRISLLRFTHARERERACKHSPSILCWCAGEQAIERALCWKD